MSDLEKLSKLPPLRAQVYERLDRAILSGELAAGERLTERKIASFLGVSRTPVREAMNMLSQKGILKARDGGGYEIYVPSMKEIKESYELRNLLEPVAIKHVIESISPQKLSEIKTIMEAELVAHKKDDPGTFAIRNLSFRQKLYESLENSMIRKILEGSPQLHYVAMVTLKDPGVRQTVLEGQKKVYEALKKGDANQAKKAVKAHLKSAERAITECLDGDAGFA